MVNIIMKLNIHACLTVAFAAAVSLCGISLPAWAGVAVSPLKQEISVKPGQTERFRITVTNNVRDSARAKAETVHLSLVDVAVAEDGRLSFMDPGSMPRSASRWIKLHATEVVVEPGQSKVIEGAVTAPQSASGEFYSAVMVTLGAQGKTDKGVAMTYRVASGLFVTVTGRSFPRRAEIARREVIWPEPGVPSTMPATQPTSEPASQPMRLPPVKVGVVLKNTGQARFDASGRVRILDEKSRTVFAAPLRSGRPCVFGGDSRLFEAVLDKPLPAGGYVLHVDMDYQSQWGKARHRQAMEITPERARHLEETAGLAMRQQGGVMASAPAKLGCEVAPGAFRSLSIAVKNTGENSAPFSAVLTAQNGDSSLETWWSVEPDTCELASGAQRSFALLLRVPADAPPGKYVFSFAIMTAQADASVAEMLVPVEVDVKAR